MRTRIKNLLKKITMQMVWAVLFGAALFIYCAFKTKELEYLEMVSASQTAHNAIDSQRYRILVEKYDGIAKEAGQTYRMARFYFNEAKEVDQEIQEHLKGRRHGKTTFKPSSEYE
jgi:hypothetical protein